MRNLELLDGAHRQALSVERLVAGSPAAAVLREGDLLLAIDGRPLNRVRDVERAIDESPVVVIGMAQNPHVRKVRKALTSAGIEHRYLEFGSYVSEWRRRLAIKLWSGWPTFPQVFVNGSLIGGEDLTVAAIDSGKLKKMLER